MFARTFAVCAARNARRRSRTSARSCATTAAASSAAFVAPALPIASVPTGMPAGICTIESRLSIPLSAFDCTGTPKTGTIVLLAHIPGRWAAPPAPAMIARSPRPSAAAAYSNSRSGVRCALTTSHSCGTPSSSSIRAACCMVSQSDCEPMITPTMGAPGVLDGPEPAGGVLIPAS